MSRTLVGSFQTTFDESTSLGSPALLVALPALERYEFEVSGGLEFASGPGGSGWEFLASYSTGQSVQLTAIGALPSNFYPSFRIDTTKSDNVELATGAGGNLEVTLSSPAGTPPTTFSGGFNIDVYRLED